MTQHALPQQLMAISRVAQIELEVRAAESQEMICSMAVNDTHRVIEYDHALIWLRRKSAIAAISGGLVVEKSAPQIAWFEKLCRSYSANGPGDSAGLITMSELPKNLQPGFDLWISGNAIWIPMKGVRGLREGGLVLLREKPFLEAELNILTRLTNAYGHALTALRAPVRERAQHWYRTRGVKFLAAGVALVILLNIPIPLSVLAEARIAPRDPILVTSPLNAVINRVMVRPNTTVDKGDTLFDFDHRELKSAATISEKRVSVLMANRFRAEQKGFEDAKARAELGLIEARLAQTYAELDRATEQLSRTRVRSPASGVVLFDAPEGWEGRPVQIGEKVMLLADPKKIKLEIEIPIDDVLVVEPGSEVRFFLAIRPSDPVLARLTNVSYSVKIINNQKAVFIGEAELDESAGGLRLGLTGTAKIIGPREPLYYVLLRKPLSAMRRLFGI